MKEWAPSALLMGFISFVINHISSPPRRPRHRHASTCLLPTSLSHTHTPTPPPTEGFNLVGSALPTFCTGAGTHGWVEGGGHGPHRVKGVGCGHTLVLPLFLPYHVSIPCHLCLPPASMIAPMRQRQPEPAQRAERTLLYNKM